MGDLSAAAQQAFALLVSGDRELWEIIGVSFRVSLIAVLIVTPAALVAGLALLTEGDGSAVYFWNVGGTFVAPAGEFSQLVPSTLSGTAGWARLYVDSTKAVFDNTGRMVQLDTDITPQGGQPFHVSQTAMVIGQMILGFPLLLALGHSALAGADRRAWETARTLGASTARAMWTVMREVRFGLLAAIIAAFARVVAEVGASLMLGGNIEHATRNIPTAIALETSKGEYAQGIALGVVLFVLALGLNFTLNFLHGKGEMR